jgi:hypothetical protein
MSSEVSKQISCILRSFNSWHLYVVLISVLLLLAFLSVLYSSISFHLSHWKTKFYIPVIQEVKIIPLYILIFNHLESRLNEKIFQSWMIKNVQILNLLLSPVNVSRWNSSLDMESNKQCSFQSSIWKLHISNFNLHTLSCDFLLKRMWYYTDIYWDNTARRWDKKGM